MAATLPLFALSELARLKGECAQLRAKLKRGGMDARSRIRTEQRLTIAVAQQIRLEQQLGYGKGGKHV